MGRAKKAKAAELAAEPAWPCFDQWSVDFPSERFLLSGRSCYQRHAEGRCSLVLDVCMALAERIVTAPHFRHRAQTPASNLKTNMKN